VLTSLVLISSLAVTLAEPVEYVVDPAGTEVYALVLKQGLAAGLAHDHVVRAGELTGRVVWDVDQPSASEVRVSFDTASLEPDSDEMRARVGLPGNLSERQRATILGHILDEDQLHATAFPTIAFSSTAVEGAGPEVVVSGALTVRGVAQPVSAPLQVVPGPEGGLVASGSFTIVQRAFGYRPYRAAMGALAVQDPVEVVLRIALREP